MGVLQWRWFSLVVVVALFQGTGTQGFYLPGLAPVNFCPVETELCKVELISCTICLIGLYVMLFTRFLDQNRGFC